VVLVAAALIALIQAAPPVGGDWFVLREPAFGTRFRVDPSLVTAARADELTGGGAPDAAPATGTPPPCVADVCQPRVSVPGFERKLDMRGKRTELFLAMLDRVHFEPIASLAWAVARTGVRLDYTPAAINGPNTLAHGGWGHFQVWLSFRLDAANAPVFMERPGRPVTPSP
jgi:hypothetical protein